MSPQDLEALAPLYALDALDGEDLALFTEALKTSESLRALVREYRETATALPRALDPVAPSPSAKGRLMESIAPAAPRSAPVFTRLFWSLAAVVLIALIGRSLLHPPRVDSMNLIGDKAAPSARGQLTWRGRSVEVTVSGLPPLPAGKVYQLWHLGPAPRPVPAATFTLDASGELHGWDTMKHAIARSHAFAITLEPSGGSLSPTLPLYVKPAP